MRCLKFPPTRSDQRDRLHRQTMDFLGLKTALHSCLNILSERDISPTPGGAAKPQGQVVQGGGQLPGVRGVGQGWANGKPGQAPGCFLPDMLVVGAEGLVDVEQDDKVLGLLQIGQHT